MKKLLFLIIVGMIASSLQAQSRKRLKPAVMYKVGDTLYAPHYGFTSYVPEGWQGTLPRETEVLLLYSVNNYGEIYVFGSDKGNLEEMKKSWLNGFDLNETMKLKATNNAEIVDGVLMSEVIVAGPSINNSFKGYAAAKCSPHGPCVTSLAIVQAQFIEPVKKTIQMFMKNSSFDQPREISPYADLNWQEYLSGKMVITFANNEVGYKENEIHLCKDGTFSAKINKKGMLKSKDNPDYNGKLTGTWKAEGIGEQGTVHLTSKKLPSISFDVNIKNDKVFVNGERYFVAESEKCK